MSLPQFCVFVVVYMYLNVTAKGTRPVGLDCQGFNFRTNFGSHGVRDRERERRNTHHCRDGSYHLTSSRSAPRIDSKHYYARNDYNSTKEIDYRHNGRILIGNNIDSGLGESTPQDFSSCCSSSAGSTRRTRVVRIYR